MKTWDEITARYPLDPAVEKLAETQKRGSLPGKWVVLDDDPTGVQTVHDLPVYTDWKEDTLEEALREEGSMFYILTNSRALTAQESERLHRELMEDLVQASRVTGVPFRVISRGDSTLRGHFPLETDIIGSYLDRVDGVILAPFFEAGGRFTVEHIHYVKQGDLMVPAGETEFAKDATFGYTQSDLTKYIEEKAERKEDVLCVPLEMLRKGDVEGVYELLSQANGRYIVVDALAPIDLKVFSLALHKALAEGASFVYRTAADFVKAVGGISDKPLLKAAEMKQKEGAGIVIIGSHTQKTTAQLEALKTLEDLDFVLFDSDKVLEGTLAQETERVRLVAEEDIRKGITPVIYTRRTLLSLPEDTKEQALLRSVAISDALTAVVGTLMETPAFIVAKGGITSSDVGVKALKVRRAWVLGQAQPGVPVWQCGKESRFPGVPYIIFPGNVGQEDTLKKIVEELI